MKGKKVYISGAVSGLPFDEAQRVFATREAALNHAGYEAVNPLRLSHERLGADKTWEEYMAFDLLLLLECDMINFLDGWQNSQGARLELEVAKLRKIETLDGYE